MKKSTIGSTALTLLFLLGSLGGYATTKPGKPKRGGGGFDIANLSMGGGLSFTHYGAAGINSLGLNIRGEYNLTEKNSVVIGFTYGFPNKFSTTVSANALDGLNPVQQIDVPATYSFSFHELYVQYDRYFFTTNADDFGFYGLLGGGMILVPNGTVSYGTYDKTQYSLQDAGGSAGTSGFIIRAGLGFSIKLGPVIGYAEGKLDIPANNVNGQSVDVTIPFGMGGAFGVRVPFGGGGGHPKRRH